MSDFAFLEQVATRIIENRTHLNDIEDELSTVNFRIHEIPLKSPTESSFAKMIGQDYYDATTDLEKAKEKLITQKEDLSIKIKEDISLFITEFTSSNLVIPLDSNSKVTEGNTVFHYKDNATFKNILAILSELLGLSPPILVKDVMFSASEIIIKVTDEYEAKQKFLSSMNEIQKTLSIKRQ